VIARRTFIGILAGGMLTVPRGLVAQQPVKSARVGWIAVGPGPQAVPANFQAFRDAMRESGWVEGQNLVVESRFGNSSQANALAAELVDSKVNVIVAQGPMTFGAKAATSTIPVVFAFSGDPVDAKLVASLARPDGNLTGVTLLSFELARKRLELLKEAFPGLARVAILANLTHPGEQAELRESQVAAERLGLRVQYLPVRTAGDFGTAFEAIEREGSEAIVAFPDLLIMSQANAIAQFAARRRIPSVSGWPEFARQGNLMTYGPGLAVWRQVAGQVDKILKGARPTDLPVEQPTKFELVINLKTAKALGITIPQSLLQRADEVIQ
jgi:putative tryptophan/tyrosine transport system substrate-binding protein